MKKLLIASTALSLAGGAAFAEMAITVSGDAELGVDYNSEPGMTDDGMTKSKHTFVHEVGIDFSGSGTTDGGLTFGGSAGFNSGGDSIDEGTVHVSGSFGTLTIGDNDSADVTAGGIDDIGLNGIGVDDKVEGLRGTTANQLRYDNSFGQISIAISAGTKNGSAAVKEVRIKGDVERPAAYWAIIDVNNVISEFSESPDSDQIDPLINVLRTMDGDGEITGISDRDSDGTAGSYAIYSSAATVGYADHDDDSDTPDVLVADVNAEDGFEAVNLETDAGKAVAATYERYVAVYDLGKDEEVGGTGDDADKRKADADLFTNEARNSNGRLSKFYYDYRAMSDDIVEVEGKDAGKSETEFAFGMSFEAGGVTIGVGYDSNKTVSMGAGFSTGEISTNLLYVKMDDNEDTNDNEEATGMGVDMTYTMGASAVTLAYGRHKPEMGEATDAVGMGVTHDLGGGATMNAGFGKVDEANKASIGLSFKF